MQIWSRFFLCPSGGQAVADPGDNIRCRSRGPSISRLAGWSRSLVDSKINYSSVHPKCTSILSWPLVCFSSAARIVAQSGVSIGVPFEVDQLTAADENRDGWSRLFFLLFLHSFFSPLAPRFFSLGRIFTRIQKIRKKMRTRRWTKGDETKDVVSRLCISSSDISRETNLIWKEAWEKLNWRMRKNFWRMWN